MTRSRSGMALALVLALLLVIGAFSSIVMLLSRSASREVDVLKRHLRAVNVADAVFAEVVARLSATRWEDRWFKIAADVKFDVALAGGLADYVIRDTRQGAPVPFSLVPGSANQVDLLVNASYDRSRCVVFWRLSLPWDSL